MAKKEKRAVKTKEEIAHGMEMQYEQTRQRKLIKERVYPFLLENSKSISDAKNLCYAASSAIESTYQMKMQEEQKRLSGLRLSDMEVSKNVNAEENKRDLDFLDFFSEEKVSTAAGLIQGLKQVIESFEREESIKRPLSSLPAELLD
jgi:hypothetical protein